MSVVNLSNCEFLGLPVDECGGRVRGMDGGRKKRRRGRARPRGDGPNIVFILIDDLGWRDLACYGSSFYETPNLDRLAAEGMRFTDAYAAAPVCSPTRASILSGKYPARVGVTQYIGAHAVGRLGDVPYHHNLPLTELSLASALRQGGYRTWHVGKWHLGRWITWPDVHGFDVNIGGCDWGGPRNGHFSPYGCPTMSDGPRGEYLTDRLTDEAIRLIRKNDGQPFFLNLWHYAVHVPIQAPAALVRKYEAKARDLGLNRKDPFVEGDRFPVLHKRTERIRRRIFQSDPAYAAMVENLDWNVGRLLDALERRNLADNTLVVFNSDNGGLSTAEGSPTCNWPLSEGKGWMQEGGNRVCLMARWPGVTRGGTECRAPVTSPDLYPTFLDAAGLALRPEQHCDGKSLTPLLRGRRDLKREAIFWHYPHYANQGDGPAGAVRAGDWKLIEHFEDGRLALYNLREDPGEHRDLAAARTGERRRLHALLRRWREEVDARIPSPNPRWEE